MRSLIGRVGYFNLSDLSAGALAYYFAVLFELFARLSRALRYKFIAQISNLVAALHFPRSVSASSPVSPLAALCP